MLEHLQHRPAREPEPLSCMSGYMPSSRKQYDMLVYIRNSHCTTTKHPYKYVQ